jgi:hypothetical protein
LSAALSGWVCWALKRLVMLLLQLGRNRNNHCLRCQPFRFCGSAILVRMRWIKVFTAAQNYFYTAFWLALQNG